MILGFSKYFPWGEPTLFREKIISSIDKNVFPRNLRLDGPKIHSIRGGDRWRPGLTIQMAYWVRSKQYFQFNKGIPELSLCKVVQGITIYPLERLIWIEDLDRPVGTGRMRLFPGNKHEILAINDGLSLEEFWRWFGKKEFVGQIIHWTELKYTEHGTTQGNNGQRQANHLS